MPGTVGSQAASTRYPASIKFEREADLAFRFAGSLTSVHGQIGDRLARGQIVARIDGSAYISALARANADVERLTRADARNRVLVEAGAVAAADAQDLRSTLRAARAARDAARYDLASATLRMPFDGIVLTRDTEAGSVVGPGTRVLRIADVGSARIARAQVTSAAASRLYVGQAASLAIVGQAETIAGRVWRIGGYSDPATGSVTIDVELLGGSRLASGTTGSVAFVARPPDAAGTLQIPVEALLEATGSEGQVFIAVGSPAVARRVTVRVLAHAGEMIAVAGLPADAQVITAGAGFVKDGQPVVVTRR